MFNKYLNYLILLYLVIYVSSEKQNKFSDDFIFGTATASYQIEGAWNEDGKGENIWDYMTHNRPHVIDDKSNGDVACDSYHKIQRDVEMMRELNLDAHRFSLSWSRILPTGFANKINPAGIQYYNDLIDEMLKYNIQPMVTLYHWDLPQPLQELGGWTNPQIVDWFSDFARVAFENFANRVKLWITFNEPKEICYQGYGIDTKAPQVNMSGIANYMCDKYILLSHAKAYHIYNDEFKSLYSGKCGFAVNCHWYEANSDSEEDIEATEDMRDFEWGLYLHPIFSESGDFPEKFKQKIAAKSSEQGFPRSRLPEFTQDEIDYVKGSGDFFGLNHYTAYIVYRNESVLNSYEVPSYLDDVGVATIKRPEWTTSASSWLTLSENSLYNQLVLLKDRYNNPDVYITENGWSTTGGIDDDERIIYYRTHLTDILNAIKDGCNVKGYMAWSLMDNFEWMHGFSQHFGLYKVNFEDPDRTRTPRKSAFVYKEIVRSRFIDPDYEPDTNTMWIEEGH